MKAYIIEFDNGQDYEDHGTEVLAVALTEAAAKNEAARLTAWIEAKRKKMPAEPDVDLPDEEYNRQYDLRNAWVEKLHCPHGADCLKSAIRDDCGSVRHYSVPLLP